LKRGQRVTVLDGAGHEFFCEVENAAKDSLTLAVKETKSTPPLPCALTLLQAVPKGKIIESIIQKAVELGTQRIVPVLSGRVVTQLDDGNAESKRDKWQTVAVEAIKQCGAAWLPKVEMPTTIERFLARNESFDLPLVGSLQKERRHPRECLSEFQIKHKRLPHSVGVWIGPEGDFTLGELQAIQAAGALPISLGRLVLRVETAAIYCLSILNYELNSK
jgi:16S rRNA (uracil1498-N3)-methyltransferase